MLSLHISKVSETIFSHYRNSHEKPAFSSLKKTVTNRTNFQGFTGPASSPISKFRLAAAGSAGRSDGIHDERSTVIQLPEDLRAVELMPKHVAIIMDGHGRWAKERGLAIQDGHDNGLANLRRMVLHCCKYGIKALTVFAFSTENWTRSKEEVDFLMSAYEDLIQSYIKELITSKDLRFSVIGDKAKIPPFLQNTISSAEESSKANKGLHFVMAISYGGRDDITEATKKIATKVENGDLRAKDINETLLSQQLMTNTIEFPNPDLLIRTSGELRVSNFLLWQLAYAEFYFADKLFPDFDEAAFVEALRSFQRRQRRYGRRKN